MAAEYPDVQNVLAKKSLPRSAKVYWIAQQLSSIAGFPFTVFGKHKKFNADLYADLVAPNTSCSYFTETWPNGAVNYPNTCNTTNKDIYNIVSIKIANITFPTTKDHSKWAVADLIKCGYVCIGDINRQYSQNKRAGDAACFQYNPLWNLYRNLIDDFEECPV
ncbi:unnamed protein product [Enterobius vermicularis]|uniref:Deoxyribonuclease II n=1 Tax=Enterobius vermicularis TaxID=51028 RepID=A0A0N4UTC7_ENTVE|nr:unnamed protein product [Enterobius vermicularis]